MPLTRTSRRRAGRLGGAGALLVAAGLGLTLAACGGGSPASGSPDAAGTRAGTASSGTASAAPRIVRIFAAASLQGPLDTIAKDFEAAHPEYTVAPITYDGSQALATQAIDGADVDVLALASEASLVPVTEAGLTGKGTIFASNTLEMAVAPGNPKGLRSLQDLARNGVSVVVCASEVPCGQATDKVTADAGVTLEPVSQESNVTSVVNRVAGGEADAGLVYSTDVKAAGDKLQGVALPNADKAINRYPVAVSSKAKDPEGGEAFEDYLLSAEGRKTLAEAGFGAP